MDQRISDLIGENAVLKKWSSWTKKITEVSYWSVGRKFQNPWQPEEQITTKPKTTATKTTSYTRLKRNHRQAERFRKP